MRELTLDDAIQKFEKKALQWDGVIADSSQQKEYSRKKAENYRQLAEWLKELKNLKEKEEPREVRYEGDGYADGEMVVDYAFCPSCDHEIEVDSENWGCEFCPNCGQRLRWEE